MGYELHIIRKNDYENEEEVSSIKFEEWLEYIDGDKELKLTNGYQMNIPGIDTSWRTKPGFCLWLSHPGDVEANSIWFDFYKGVISAKYPDDETIRKMIIIAENLGAKVHGDDNEVYDESYFENKNKLEKSTSISILQNFNKKPWWKF